MPAFRWMAPAKPPETDPWSAPLSEWPPHPFPLDPEVPGRDVHILAGVAVVIAVLVFLICTFT